MNNKVRPHSTAEIRSLLAAAFDDVDLIALCQDEFPELCDKLARGMRKDEIINVIIDYFRRRGDYAPLLAAARERELELHPVWQQRLKDLADHIAQDLALLKEYEDALRYEDDPRRRAKYLREIGQLRGSVARYRREYDELEAQTTGRPSAVMQDVAAKLQQIDDRLEMRRQRQKLLNRYTAEEQSAVAIPVEHLDQHHLGTIQIVLDALEADKVPDTLMRQTLDAVQGVLVVLHKHGADLPGQQAVVDATATPTLDVKHKLKLTLPIIPGLLRYELELGSETKLRTRWRRLKWRAYGRDSRLLLTLSVFTALALGGASYLVTDVCQLDLPQRLIITGTFCLAPAIVLLVGFYRGRIPTTTVFSSVRKGGTITGILFGTLFLVWGIGWTIWATVKPPVQVSPCLELDLVTGTGQRICPSASGELVPPPGSLDGLQNLSGRAILTHAGGCACEWEGKTREGHPLEKLHGLTRDCSFSFGLPDRPTSAYYLMLSVGEQHKLFIISVQGR